MKLLRSQCVFWYHRVTILPSQSRADNIEVDHRERGHGCGILAPKPFSLNSSGVLLVFLVLLRLLGLSSECYRSILALLRRLDRFPEELGLWAGVIESWR